MIAAPVNHGGSVRQVTKKYAGRAHASRSPQYGSHIFGQPPKPFSSFFSVPCYAVKLTMVSSAHPTSLSLVRKLSRTSTLCVVRCAWCVYIK